MEMSIGTNIRRLRLNRNITQEQLAEVMNLTCAAVSKWERGETFPDITLLQPLAYYFEVTIDELMGYSAHKIDQTIEDLLERYHTLYRTDFGAARDLIVQAYRDYPNDWRILHCYMWNIGGDYADNDPQVLLAHKDEFRAICQKLLDTCPNHHVCHDAWNMRAKLLWAEGKTDEALDIYFNHFYNWYETSGQKSEQLFPKDTPEFLTWVRRNMCDLIDFAADKLVKSHFFDPALPLKERVAKVETYGDELLRLAQETGEAFFVCAAYSFFARLSNDLKYRGGDEEDRARAEEKFRIARETIVKFSENDESLQGYRKLRRI